MKKNQRGGPITIYSPQGAVLEILAPAEFKRRRSTRRVLTRLRTVGARGLAEYIATVDDVSARRIVARVGAWDRGRGQPT